MFRLTVVSRIGKEQATVLIQGAAVFTHARELQGALGEVLASCDHLTIDLGQLEDLDATLPALICALHRHAELVHKKISLQGAPTLGQDPLRGSGVKGCLSPGSAGCCGLWDSLPKGPGQADSR